MYQKHRGRRKAYRIENAASRDASITWKNWVSIIKEQNCMVAYVNGTVFLQYTIPLKTSRVSLFEGPFCKVVTDPHIMWNWQGGGGVGVHDLLWVCGSIHVCPTKRSHVWWVCCHVLCDRQFVKITIVMIVFNLLWIFSANCIMVYHCTCSWSITESFTIDSFVTNSMYPEKHRGRRRAYKTENAATRDASINNMEELSKYR